MLHCILFKMTSTIVYAQLCAFQKGFSCLFNNFIRCITYDYLWFLMVDHTAFQEILWILVIWLCFTVYIIFSSWSMASCARWSFAHVGSHSISLSCWCALINMYWLGVLQFSNYCQYSSTTAVALPFQNPCIKWLSAYSLFVNVVFIPLLIAELCEISTAMQYKQ